MMRPSPAGRPVDIHAGRSSLATGLLLCILAVCACFSWRLGYQARHAFGAETVTHYLNGNLPTASSYETMKDTEARSGTRSPFALWTQQDWQGVQEPSTKRSAAVSAVLIRGDTRLVLPIAATLAADDYTGCLIDRKTALDLFGTADAAGSVLKWGGDAYTVRGVFDSPKRTIVLQLPPYSTMPLDCVSIPDDDNASAFGLRHGLSTGHSLSSSAYRTVAKLIGDLPVAVCILIGLECLFVLQRRHRTYPARYTLFTLLLLAGCTISFILFLAAMPRSLVPSRWSDFSFWSDSFQRLEDDFSLYFTRPQYRQDFLFLSYTSRALWGILSASLLFPLRRFLHNHII